MEAALGAPLAVPQFPYQPGQMGRGRKCRPVVTFVTFAKIESAPFTGTGWGRPPGLQQGGLGQRQRGACPVN